MLAMNTNNAIDTSIIKNWLNEKYSITTVEEKLLAMGYNTSVVADYIVAYKKQKRNKRQFIGFCFMVVGAFLGFLSCTLTILNPFPEFYNVILYGLTSLAIAVIVVGLYYVFED